MDYGAILRRAWDVIWENKFLILLGILVALSSGGNSATTSTGTQFRGDRDVQPPQDFEGLPDWGDLGLPVFTGVVLVVVVIIAVIIGLAFWVISTIARGALIASVDTIASGGSSTFSQAFSSGWQNGWRLLGIAIIPAIPGVILFIAGLAAAGVIGGLSRLAPMRAIGPNIGALAVGIVCLILPISLVLNLLRFFANRASTIENLGVLESYARGWEVLTQNLGEAIVLFLIQIAIWIVLGLLLILPSLCCILWPLLLLVQGAISAYFSTLWTLAWREWTLKPQMV